MIYNRCAFQGNIGRIDVKPANDGVFVTFSLAVSNLKQGQYETMWINCIAFGKTAERMQNWQAGSKIWVEGRLDKNDYTNKDGIEVKSYQLIVSIADKLKDPSNEVVDTTATSQEDIPF